MDDTLLRNYLLGQLNAIDRQRVEESLRLNDMNVSQLSIIEDELIDDYVSDQMSDEDREQFEKFFLEVPARAEKLRFGLLFHSFLTRSSNKDQSQANHEKNQSEEPGATATSVETQHLLASSQFHRVPKIAIMVGLACIFACGSIVLLKMHNLRNQIDALENKQEQLRIRIGKIEKNLNVDDENNGANFKNLSRNSNGLVIIPEMDKELATPYSATGYNTIGCDTPPDRIQLTTAEP